MRKSLVLPPLHVTLPLSLLAILSTTDAHADLFLRPWEDHHESFRSATLGADVSYFYSTLNYDPSGSTYNPSGFGSYSRGYFDVSAMYGFNPRLTGYVRATWEMAKVNTSNTAVFSGTTWGFGDQTVGLNYRVLNSSDSLTLDLQLQADIPAYGANTNATPVVSTVLGDGTLDISGGGILNFPVSNHALGDNRLILSGAAAYTYRNLSYSSEIPWSVTLALTPQSDHSEGFLGELQIFGESSLNTDSRSSNSTIFNNSLATSFNSGGSYITGAINPSLAAARGQIGYQWDGVQVVASVAQTFWGRSAVDGLTGSVGIRFLLGPDNHASPADQSPDQYNKSNKGYVDYNLEAKVTRANDHFNLIKIDKGLEEGVHVGDVFDVFQVSSGGVPGSAIARAKVTSVKPNESALKVEEYFKEVWIDEGFVARRTIN